MDIQEASEKFSAAIAKISSSPELDTQILIAAVIGRNRAFVLAHPKYELTGKEALRLGKHLKKRLSGYPVAYITGHKEFMGLDFLVNKHVLVPRPETEMMVEITMTSLPVFQEKILVLDIGTGSGAIITSLAKKLENKENICFVASDISRKALRTAKRNIRIHEVRVKLYHRNLLSQFPWRRYRDCQHLVICANLPYISPEEYVNLETIKCEPKKALISRDKGLDHYRRLSRQLAAIPNNFQTIKAYFEISPWQEKMMINDIFPNSQPIADLSGRTRFIKIDR